MIPSRTPGAADREEAAEILALHGGNALEALRTMIAERDAVEERLAIATMVIAQDRAGLPYRRRP